MIIYIPTMGRVYDQRTLGSLAGTTYTLRLVCPVSEAEQHTKLGRLVMTVPDNVKGIAATRQFIMTHATTQHVVMMDDDLVFAERRDDDPTKFHPVVYTEQVEAMLHDLESLFENYAHVSIAAREGANRVTSRFRYNQRNLRVLGYNALVFKKLGLDFREMEVMEDFHVNLGFLRAGHGSAMLNWYVQDQKMSGAAGGCSTYRNMEMQSRSAERLAELHPGYVKVVEKTTKTAWGGATRKDVIVQWKKAYEESRHA